MSYLRRKMEIVAVAAALTLIAVSQCEREKDAAKKTEGMSLILPTCQDRANRKSASTPPKPPYISLLKTF